MLRLMDGWQLSGTRYTDGMPGVLAWDGAHLDGDADTLRAAAAYLAENENVLAVTPTGPFWLYDAGEETHAWVLAVLLLGSGGDLKGTAPELNLPPIPSGAIP